MKCDFCSSPRPAWTEPSYDADTQVVHGRSVDPWASCQDCHVLIAEGDRLALARHAVRHLGLPGSLGLVVIMHDAFWRNRTGEPARLISP
jgi:hypothetical protein